MATRESCVFKVLAVMLSLTIAMLWPAKSFAQQSCSTGFTVNSNPKTWRANRSNLQTIRIDVRFDQRPDQCVVGLLFFTDNDPYITLTSSGGEVTAELVDRSRQIYPQFIVNGRIAYFVPVDRDRRIRVWAELTTNEALIAGNYVGQFAVTAISNFDFVSDEVVGQVDLEVASQLSISVQTGGNPAVSGNNGFYNVDLGRMFEGRRVDWNLDIYSNTHYDVSVSSEYRGLRHRLNGELVPYDVIMDGNRFNAADGFLQRYTNYNPLTDFTVPFAVIVGNTDFKPAGEYVDYLVVTVSAR